MGSIQKGKGSMSSEENIPTLEEQSLMKEKRETLQISIGVSQASSATD
jgi:hypothetical protein